MIFKWYYSDYKMDTNCSIQDIKFNFKQVPHIYKGFHLFDAVQVSVIWIVKHGQFKFKTRIDVPLRLLG